jgi:hypothetical protein
LPTIDQLPILVWGEQYILIWELDFRIVGIQALLIIIMFCGIDSIMWNIPIIILNIDLNNVMHIG